MPGDGQVMVHTINRLIGVPSSCKLGLTLCAARNVQAVREELRMQYSKIGVIAPQLIIKKLGFMHLIKSCKAQ